jgi:hypothetical protein
MKQQRQTNCRESRQLPKNTKKRTPGYNNWRAMLDRCHKPRPARKELVGYKLSRGMIGSRMIEFRPLTREEAQSGTHFCGRCETWQKRFELHQCAPTERWKAAKAAMWAKNPMPPPHAKQAPETPVERADSVDSEPDDNAPGED